MLANLFGNTAPIVNDRDQSLFLAILNHNLDTAERVGLAISMDCVLDQLR